MKLYVDDDPEERLARWAEALRDLEIRHPDPAVDVAIALLNRRPPQLQFCVRNAIETLAANGTRIPNLVVSTIDLAWWPGTALLRAWLAAAWAGYMQHEALELVTVNGCRVCDPHTPSDDSSTHRLRQFGHDRGVRDGFPTVLTRETLTAALATAMDRSVAEAMVRRLE